ncbi:MAG: 23S rRNA pseudouridine955/2504/2580 synthase [Myxococcota bacterium]
MTDVHPAQPRVLLDADGLIVVDKPPGLASTGRSVADPDCVQGWLIATLRRDRIWAVHQLDKDTSGLNLFVRRKALVDVWAQRLKEPPSPEAVSVKRYLAICHGHLAEPRWVDAAIGRKRRPDGRTYPAIVSVEGNGDGAGKPARSYLTAVAHATHHTLVEVRPLQGRTHQVRLHLAHIGLPVVGERAHMEPPCEVHPRHALHASVLDFGDHGRFESPLPADLEDLAQRLGLATG